METGRNREAETKTKIMVLVSATRRVQGIFALSKAEPFQHRPQNVNKIPPTTCEGNERRRFQLSESESARPLQ